MSGKASSQSRRNFFHRIIHSTRKGSEGIKNGDHQAGTVVASPSVSATPSNSAAKSSMTGKDASHPAQSSPVPASMELRSPEQVAPRPAPSSSSVQQPATTLSAEHPPLSPQIASPPLTVSGAQPTTSDTIPFTSSDLPVRLWNRAYDELKAVEDKLVDAYEKILSRELDKNTSTSLASEDQRNAIEQANPEMRRSQMRELILTGLKKTEKEAKVKQGIGNAMQGVLNVKDIIDSAVQACPQAALAWTGVSLALQMLVNPTKETETNRVGIDYVIKKMSWYWNLSSHLLKEDMLNGESYAGLRSELKDRVVDLYKILLSYQMKSVCSYYRNRGLVFLRDLIMLDDWDGDLKIIQAAETAVLQDSHVYNSQQIISHHEEDTKLLQDIHRSLQDQASLQRDTREEENDKTCLKDLRLTDPAADMERIENSKDFLLTDSYVWILGHRDFIDWRDGETNRLLWIKGDPGKGKTMLLMGVIKEFLNSPPDSSLLSFFFCQATDTNLDNATAVLRGLIYQMLVQQHALISHLRRKYDNAGPKLFEGSNAFFDLSSVFADMLRDPSLKSMYLIVDALDECQSALDQLLQLIVQNASRVKWLVSSRHRQDIEEQLRLGKGRLELDLEENVQDQVSQAVTTYIDHKASELARLKQYDSKLQDNVRSYLHMNSDGTFLWVALVCKQLADPRTLRRKTLSVLKSFPPGLRPFYKRMIEQIHAQSDSEDLELCKQILASSTLAYRPIRLEELISIASLPDELSNDQESLKELVSLCGSFLIVRKGIIYFVHQSAKDYLIEDASLEIFPHGHAEGHRTIASRSLQAMSTTLRRDIYSLQDPGYSIEDVKSPDPDPLTSIRYACVYWIDHLCEIKSGHNEVGLSDNGAINVFLKEQFLHWLEALSLMRSMSTAVVAIRKLENLLSRNPNNAMDSLSVIRDANRFVLYNRGIIEKAPLQAYASALVFSPSMSKIRTLFQHQQPSWISTSPLVEENWNPCLQTLEGHTSWIYSVTFSPDGQRLASGSRDDTIRIWDAETGALQQTLEGHTNSINSVTFSPDGQRLASGSRDDTIRIWDAETGALQQTLEGHTSSINSVTFSPDGQRLASSSDDETIRIWDAETGALQQTLEGHTNWIYSVTFSPDGQRLASGSRDDTIRIWDAETGALQQTLEGHTNSINSVTFSPDGQRLASGSRDDTIRIWDAETGALQQTLEGHTNSINSVTFSPDGQRLASSSDDETIQIWDAETGALQQTLEGHTNSINSVTFSPDGQRLASGSHDETIRIWDAETGALQQTLEGHTKWINSVTFSPDGQRLASSSHDETIRIWDAETGALQQTLKGYTNSINSVTFSPDGQRLASGSRDETIRIWDAETGALQQTLEGHTNWIYSVTFSPDGQRLASGSRDDTIRIWDAETGALQQTLKGHTNSINSVTFSPDGQRLASGSRDKTIRIWDAETGALQQTLEGHTNSINSVTFSPDGQRLASGSRDETIRIWDAETGALQQTLEISTSLEKLSFSPDDHSLITELGYIALNQSSSVSSQTPNWSAYCLHAGRSWITWNNKNVLWIPPEYRLVASGVRKETIVIGCSSGRVLLFRFHPEISPRKIKQL